jgi:D-glycero-alpha-D-manno-heptose-7-phosphate kinase
MIISRTPLRISFVGGGSDLPIYYRSFGGAVISTSINMFVYVTVNRKFDEQLRVSYSKTETVESTAEVEHPIVRTVLQRVGISGGLEITSIADIPSSGSGLGSSSAFTVGLLNAINAYSGVFSGRKELAEAACEVEIDELREPIGKQDQFASALGGFNYLRFNPNDTVDVEPLTHMRPILSRLEASLLMFYMGYRDVSSVVLSQQHDNLEADKARQKTMGRMVELTEFMRKDLEVGNIESFGEILHENWMLKRTLAKGITNGAIDDIYCRARAAGARGGKVLGAGGGGFFLVVAPPERHPGILKVLKDLRPIDLRFESLGTTIVFSETNHRSQYNESKWNSTHLSQPPLRSAKARECRRARSRR